MKIKNIKLKILLLGAVISFSACQSFRTFIGDYSAVKLDQPLWQEAYSEWTPELPAQNKNLPRLNRNVTGGKLKVDSLEFETGIGVGGDAVFVYSPNSKAAFIEFSAGVDDASLSKHGKSRLEVICDGKPLKKSNLFQGGNPEYHRVYLQDIQQVIIHINAETNVYTDLLMPRIVGISGLRDALKKGKTYFEDFVFETHYQPPKSVAVSNDSILFPAENNCIGISNNFISLVVSPRNGGKVIYFGDKNKSVINCSNVGLHPADRIRSLSSTTYEGTWKWQVDELGILRLLSPPDLANGVRWSRTFQLISNVLKTVVMAKNCVGHEISWSFGTEFGIPENSTVYFAAETARPGFKLLSDSSLGIDLKDNLVCVASIEKNENRIIGSGNENWLAVKKDDSVFLAKAIEIENGYYPYNGSKVMVKGNKAILFSEITPLLPGKYIAEKQFWTIEPLFGSIIETLEKAAGNIKTANEISKFPYGKPTGRKLVTSNR